MAASTWQNITTGMNEATYKSYMRKSSHQRKRREVAEDWCDFQNFCQKAEEDIRDGRYHVGKYRHFKLKDRKKVRDMVIVHDWSGFYFDGTVYTDAEEEEMIRKQFNIPKLTL